jgi:hypothetical protein
VFISALGVASGVSAQGLGIVDPAQNLTWAPGAINQARQVLVFKDVQNGSQTAPFIIPEFSIDPDPTGLIATYQRTVSP